MNSAAHAPTVSAALAAGRTAVCDQQDKEGGWAGDFATGGTSWESADILMQHVLGTPDPAHIAEQRAWILAQQNDDGGFPLYTGGPSDLSCSVLTHCALQLAGHDEDRDRLGRAAHFVRDNGGIEAAELVPTRFWLALTGVVGWEEIPPLPPELILLPSWFPGTVDDFEPLARELVVAIGILGVVRPVRELPLDTGPLRRPATARRTPLGRTAGTVLVKAANAVNRTSPAPLRRKALHRAERWLLSRQEPDGSWGGSWTETMVCVLALWSLGYGTRHPVIAAALEACDRYCILGDGTRRVRIFPCTVMDTAITLRALAAAGGRAGSDPAVDRAVDWLMTHRSDSTANAAHPAAMAWDYEGIPTVNPDVDDTAMVIAAFHQVGVERSPETDTAVAEGIRWIMEWQSGSGGWSGYGVYRWSLIGKRALTGIGFIEPPSPCVTAHIVEMLCLEGYGWHPKVRRALSWLLDQQDTDGSWPARWGGRLYGTAQVLFALMEAGLGSEHPAVAAAMEWIYQHQNDDGGWGEDIPSSLDAAPRATGESMVVQTAWCVIAAHTTGVVDDARLDAAVAYLIKHQREDGGWTDEREWMIIIPNNVYAVDDALTNAYALWALALHARHTERGEGR
ncbi:MULTISPECIES: prenyltransferase/squalene oxidase repeat-containing protein [unclassified Streptomyces]|uniref:prenyltransferase/squalene oxidase repeat-containing protein n=1 Tax=unclassified Streptomyces TaxID=2593676 RepID=UPI000F748446|nr:MULTISPECIES: prenyltransferase/squalene oxidase repeat-containing protein [unclassified Streptomyces]